MGLYNERGVTYVTKVFRDEAKFGVGKSSNCSNYSKRDEGHMGGYEDKKSFKKLLEGSLENNFIVNGDGGGIVDREDKVELIWPSKDPKKGDEIEVLKRIDPKDIDAKQEGLKFYNTAAQIAMLTVEKEEPPQKIVWERFDIRIDGAGSTGNVFPIKRLFSFEALKWDVLGAARALNPEEYSDKSLEYIGWDLIRQKRELNKRIKREKKNRK